MKLLPILILLIIQSTTALAMLNNSNESLEQVRQTLSDEKIKLIQLKDAYDFLASNVTDSTKNFLVSPFFKNRCGGLYSLIVNENLKNSIEDNLKNLGFYEYHELFSATDMSVLSAVDFILTRSYPAEISLSKMYLLIKKGITIGSNVLNEGLQNKKDCDAVITKILDNFGMKFNENKLQFTRYFNVEDNSDILYKFVSVVNFKMHWENEFQYCADKLFSLNDGSLIATKFMKNIINTVVAKNSYGVAYRIFGKNNKYVLDIIVPSEKTTSINNLSGGYQIDLIRKLNLAQNTVAQNKKYFIIMPEFEFKQFNNNITDYFEKSLLNGDSIDNGINFLNSSDIERSAVLQDINIKVDKRGVNIDKIEKKATKNFTVDTSEISKGSKHIVNKQIIDEPFFFMLSELDELFSNYITIKKIIALGKINNPTIVE